MAMPMKKNRLDVNAVGVRGAREFLGKKVPS